MKRVLIVDDDEGILDATSLILEASGYSVDTTPRGEETYKKIDKFHPDVILLDVLMSGTDGREICKKLKASEKTRKIPIIMFSANPSARQTSLKTGANDFLNKPFDLDDLLNRVEKLTS